MLALGIFSIIINPLIKDKAVNVKDIVSKFVRYMSLPFLTIIASILIVTILEIVAELFFMLKKEFETEKVILYYIFITAVSIAIIAISIIINTEYKIHKGTSLEEIKTEEVISGNDNPK